MLGKIGRLRGLDVEMISDLKVLAYKISEVDRQGDHMYHMHKEAVETAAYHMGLVEGQP